MAHIDLLRDSLQELFNANDYDGAKHFLRNLIVTSAEDPAASALLWQWLGQISYYENDLSGAYSCFVENLKLTPNSFHAQIFLARIAEQRNQTHTALKLYASCLSLRPSFLHMAHQMRHLAAQGEWCDPAIGQILDSSQSRSHQVRSPFPKISIIVLCYNKVEYTERCLASIFKNTEYPNFEVVVVDNASVDNTPSLLESYGKKIKYVRSRTNLAFVGGNNLGIEYAEGEYVLFLNNDTEVHPQWLTEIHSTFARDPRVGAVGSMLLFGNGMLQEAGGVIFNDASGWNYGRMSLPTSPLFNFAREVDYSSGAALALRTDIFKKLGGFDQLFAPGYFEDTDLCFSVRKLGYKVMFCPGSKVTHYEGISSGTDVTVGMKRFQVINAPKFREKWKNELAAHYPNDVNQRYQFSNRKPGKRVIIIDDWPPLPDRAAGSLRLYHTVRQMLNLGYQVTYVHLMGKNLDEAAQARLKELRDQGVELIWFEYEAWWEIRGSREVEPILGRLVASLELALRKADLMYICFWHIASYFIDAIRAADPRVPIVVDSMDIHYLREARQAEITKDPALVTKAIETKKAELALYSKADAVTTVTERDREILLKDLPGKAVLIMTDVHDPVETRTPFEARKDFLFVGNFNHNPNEDAVHYFLKEVFPRIKKSIPDAKFWIVGNNPTQRLKAVAREDVIVTGWVPEVRPYLEQCRVSLVPLRFGAGNKGKVGETLSSGVPMVSTTIGAEGMGIVHGEHAFVTDSAAEFASLAVELYTNREIWERFSRNGKALVASQYSSALMRQRIEYLTSFESREAFSSHRAKSFPTAPKVSIVILAHNQWHFTRQCLESIREHTRVSHETILVDNASTDKTLRGLEKHPEVRLIRNEKNLGFPTGVNQGINAALGDYVVLLNNDTVVTEGWLDRLIAVAQSDPTIGLVGPISNYVSGPQIDRGASYKDVKDMHHYAASVRESNNGSVVFFPRLAFLCTLITRELIQKIGGLDERFSPGNSEDDDYCLRAQLGGYKVAIARDVFIHHFGSRSFMAHGQEAYAHLLHANRKKFEEKWEVDLDKLWQGDTRVKKRSLLVPLHRDRFAQYFERAQILLGESDLWNGMTSLREAIQSFHRSERNGTFVEFSDVLNLAGNVSLVLGNLDEAKEYFEEELKLTPKSSRACVGLGQVFLAAEETKSAKTMLEWGVKYDRMNPRAQASLANANALLGLRSDDNALLDQEVCSAESV